MATNAQVQRVRDLPQLQDLQPYLKMIVDDRMTVGDLGFVSAQSVFSTTYQATSAADQFAPNIDRDLFQAAIGDGGQGLAAGEVMTRGQTNWIDSGGKLPSNEVFIGIRAGFAVYKHQNSAGTAGAVIGNGLSNQLCVPSVVALEQILHNLSWEYQLGDGFVRNKGPLCDWPQGGGIYQPSFDGGVSAAGAGAALVADVQYVNANAALGAQNGIPSSRVMRQLPVPLLFLPNVVTRIKVRSGGGINTISLNAISTGFTETLTVFSTSACLAVCMVIQGYKCTTSVG